MSFQSTLGTVTNVTEVSFAVSGLSSTAAIGVIDPADQFMGLTGQSTTVAQGTAVAPNEDVSPTGFGITSSQGTALGVTSHEADLTGFAITPGIGSVVVPNDAAILTGLNMVMNKTCSKRIFLILNKI